MRWETSVGATGGGCCGTGGRNRIPTNEQSIVYSLLESF